MRVSFLCPSAALAFAFTLTALTPAKTLATCNSHFIPTCPMCTYVHCNTTDNTWDCIPQANGTACNDGNACTSNDRCDGQGNCAGTLSCVPGVPGSISAPASNSSGAFAVSWGASSGVATRYDLFENGIAIIGTASPSANISGKLAGPYTYAVRCCNSAGCSAQTAGFTVTVTTPSVPGAISGPSSNSSGAYGLSWGASSGSVDHYELWENGAGILSTASLSANISAKVAGGYTYTVRGCGPTGCGGFTAGFTVTVTVPGVPGAMSGPPGNSSPNGSYTLSWGAASGTVTSYQLYEGGVASRTNLTTTTANVSGKGNGTYHYTVRACGPTGCGSFTADYVVTVLFPPGVPGPLVVLSQGQPVSNGETGAIYSVSWGVASGTIDHYELDESFQGGAWLTTAVASTSVSYTTKPYGTYSYRARACNASGCSAYTATSASFNVITPLAAFPDTAVGSLSIPDAGWVGTLPGEAGVEGGAATYHIPIEIPPGRVGMQPDVSLTYGSRNGNGVAGVGWGLSAGRSIYRCPRTTAQDWGTPNGGGRAVQHDRLDRLCFDGQRLVGPSDANYGQQDSEYRTEVDQFVRITLKSSSMNTWAGYFEVEHKSGRRTQYEPGPLLDHSSTALPPDSWLLAREFDRQGNCIQYNYNIYNSRGIDRDTELTSIVYSGTMDTSGRVCNTTPDARSVQFTYTFDRPDMRTTSRFGVGSLMTARLFAISTMVGTNYVRRYEFTYSPSVATNRSLLTSVTLCAGNSCSGPEKFPATTFVYQQDGTAFVSAQATRPGETVPLGTDWRMPIVGDLDGDGTREMVFANAATSERDLRLSTCKTISQQIGTNPSFWAGFDTPADATPLGAAADLDNDGRVDIMGNQNGYLAFAKVSCSGTAAWNVTATNLLLSGPSGLFASGVLPISCTGIDYDGDGIIDARCVDATAQERIMLRRSRNAQDWSTGLPMSGPLAPTNLVVQSTRDLNGDGNVDTIFDTNPAGNGTDPTQVGYYNYIAPNNAPFTYVLLSSLGGPAGSFKQNKSRRWLDVNGDGLPDIYDPPNYVYINRGGPFSVNGAPNALMFQRVALTVPPAWNSTRALRAFTMDVDNDGREELMVPNTRIHDYCYSDPTHKQPNGEAIYFCGADFDSAPPPYPDQDRSVFTWDAYRFVEAADGSYSMALVNTGANGALLAPTNFPLNQNDSDGDGTTDVYYQLQNSTVASVSKYYDPSTVPTSQLGPYVGQNRIRAPDLLVAATNGLNASSTWHHRPLSDKTIETNPTFACDMAGSPFYVANLDTTRSPGYAFFASSMWAVARFDESNGTVGGMNKTCFRYQNAMLNNEGRGLQGFKTIVAEQQIGVASGETSSNDLRTTTDFYQEFPLTSRLNQVTIMQVATGTTLHQTTYWWNIASGTLGQAVVSPAGTDEVNNNTDGQLASEVTTVHETDLTSGEPTRSCVIANAATPDASLGAAKDVIRVETLGFTNDTSSGVWWLARADSRKSQSDFLASPYALPTTCHINDTRAGAAACPGGTPPTPSCPAVSANAITKTNSYQWNPDSAPAGSRRKLLSESLSTPTTSESSIAYQTYDLFGNLLAKQVSARDAYPENKWPPTNPGFSSLPAFVFGVSSDGYFQISEQDALGHVSSKTVDPATGQPTSSQSVQSGPVTRIAYDDLGRLITRQTDGMQPTQVRIYACPLTNCAFRVQSFQLGAPVETSYHDLLGRAIATSTQGLATVPNEIVSIVKYNARGVKVAEYPPLQSINSPGLWDGTIPAASYPYGTFFSGMDALGRPGTKTVARDPSIFSTGRGDQNLTTNYVYSVPPSCGPAGCPAGAIAGLMLTTINVSNPASQGTLTMSRTYDRLGKLVQTTQSVSSPAAHDVKTSFYYDAAGNLILIRDSASNVTTAAYDALGRKTSVNDPDRGLWSFKWDGLGRLRSQTDAKGTLLGFQYDYDGRILYRFMQAQGDSAATQEASWQYDLNNKPGTLGAMLGQTISGATLPQNQFVRNYYYDHLLRPWRATTHIPDEPGWALKDYAVEYGYDNNFGRIKAVLFPSGENASVDYDANGNRIGESQLSATGTVLNQYRRVSGLSERGQITQQSLGFMTETNTYDDTTGMPLRMTASGMRDAQPAGCSTALMARQVDYQYDQFLNVAQQAKTFLLRASNTGPIQFNGCTPQPVVASEVYQYDELQRLQSANRSWTGITANGTTTTGDAYTYDDLGNIVSKSDYGDLYVYGSATRSGPYLAGPHAVTSVTKNGTTKPPFYYDLNGSMISGDGRTVHFDNLDRPDQVTLGSTTTKFRYAPDGSRYVQSSNTAGTTTNEYYVDKMFEHIEGPLGTEDRTYVNAAVLIRVKSGTRSVRYLHVDRLGSLDAVTTDAGIEDPSDAHGYDAFGKPRPRDWQSTADTTSWQMQPSGSNYGIERGFTGHEHLDSVYLIHMNGRVYDYRLGRFLSVDPIISNPANSQSLNPYSYIGNNPLSGVDPTGYEQVSTGCGSFSSCDVIGSIPGGRRNGEADFTSKAKNNGAGVPEVQALAGPSDKKQSPPSTAAPPKEEANRLKGALAWNMRDGIEGGQEAVKNAQRFCPTTQCKLGATAVLLFIGGAAYFALKPEEPVATDASGALKPVDAGKPAGGSTEPATDMRGPTKPPPPPPPPSVAAAPADPGRLPDSNPDWGKNRLVKELYDRGFLRAGPTNSGGGSMYENEWSGEQLRIMPRPSGGQSRGDPSAKFENDWYYRYRPGPDQRWGPHVSIPNKP